MEGRDVTVRETVDAKKERYGADDLESLFGDATKLIVAKGKKVLEFKGGEMLSEDALKAAIGPSGNLRAPAWRKGKTWMIGFHEEPYGALLD